MTGRAPHVDLDSLVKERHLGKGGQGEVWAIKERKINKEWPIAYKEYSDTSLREADFAALEAMVEFIPSLDAAVGRWLAERSAWPVAIVDQAGRSRGFLMRQVPDDFTTELATAPGRRRIADLQFLLNDQQYIERIGITISDRQRLLLLKDLADLLGRLHKLDVAVGDLSARNLLFTLAPRPACFFIDCDAMRLRGRSVLEQAETPGWKVPDGEPLATAEGDRYKFTLLAIRLFLGEQEGTDTAQLAQVSNELAVLAGWGLSANPKERPSMQDWGGALERAIADPQRHRPLRRVPASPPTAPAQAPPTVPRRPPFATAPPRTSPPPRVQYMPQAAGPTWTGQRPMPQQPRSPMSPARGAAIVAAVLAALLFIGFGTHLVRSGDGSAPAGSEAASTGTGGSGGEGQTPADGTGSAARDQAAAVDALLQENAGTRSGVGAAVASVQRCDTLSNDADVFSRAATARRDLLARLDHLDVGGLSGGDQAVTDLRTAWSASAEADDAYRRWAVSLNSGGCSPDHTGDAPEFQDAAEASGRATEAKKTFVGEWNDIADRYGLTRYSWDNV
ncbi:hypothetical protein [Streptomyces sp. H39-S7]|uniref:hypothetical protein n=1 Tax=Streptomyces sp. H39-S7 TaxID=3004357 RepID=UPI0022AE68F2|nr:hypothetical protein [Streptomyces sp. H39-S7]MCZ4120787.1 hypothetical protein [Streptomyces sp. H39-S7]